jgi:hypothetical protein
MDRTGFENLHVYQLAETLSDTIWLQEIIDELTPRLSAYIKSIGKIPDRDSRKSNNK